MVELEGWKFFDTPMLPYVLSPPLSRDRITNIPNEKQLHMVGLAQLILLSVSYDFCKTLEHWADAISRVGICSYPCFYYAIEPSHILNSPSIPCLIHDIGV